MNLSCDIGSNNNVVISGVLKMCYHRRGSSIGPHLSTDLLQGCRKLRYATDVLLKRWLSPDVDVVGMASEASLLALRKSI